MSTEALHSLLWLAFLCAAHGFHVGYPECTPPSNIVPVADRDGNRLSQWIPDERVKVDTINTCYCAAGWASHPLQRLELVPDSSSSQPPIPFFPGSSASQQTGVYRYSRWAYTNPQGNTEPWPLHCDKRIRTYYCSNHGDSFQYSSISDALGTRFRDYDWHQYRCQCDFGWIGYDFDQAEREQKNFQAIARSHNVDYKTVKTPDNLRLGCFQPIFSDAGVVAPGYPFVPTTVNDVATPRSVCGIPIRSSSVLNIGPLSNVRLDGESYSSIKCVCTADYENDMTNGDPGLRYPRLQCSKKKPCPIINGTTCNSGAFAGTCAAASQPRCTCSPLFGGDFCCPRSPASATTGKVCGDRGTCGANGTCLCNAGFAGKYCCPKLANQYKECGVQGACQSDGSCKCNAGYGGTSCEVNQQCPSSDPSLECSGNGKCLNEPNEAYLFDKLHFDDVPGTSTTVGVTVYQDEGAVQVYRRFSYAFLSLSESQFAAKFASLITWKALCSGFAARVDCWQPILENFLAKEINAGPLVQNTNWTQAVLRRLYPELLTFDGPYVKKAAALLGVNGTDLASRTSRAQGIVALFAYRYQMAPVTGDIPFPAFNEWRCTCDAPPASAVPGLDVQATDLSCAVSCPVGIGNQVCGGFFQGLMRGKCDIGSKSCICGPNSAGVGCEQDLIGLCFPAVPISGAQINEQIIPCTSPGQGECVTVLNSITGANTHQCKCAPGWTGQFCQYSLCVPAFLSDSARRVECSNKGYCQPNGVCYCDVSLQLMQSTSLAVTPTLPVGQYCQLDGYSACGSAKNKGGNVVEYQECSGNGYCYANGTVAAHCICNAGYSGPKCANAVCFGCSGNTKCNTVSGKCECLPFWGSPAGCSISNAACRCSIPLCGHGVVAIYDDVTQCKCDQYWTKDSNGKCTVAQCPLVVMTTAGERACIPGDPPCSSIDGTKAAVIANSLAVGCCYDACGSRCSINATSGAPKCACSPAVAYTSTKGICYSKCHGQPFTVVGGKVTCDCTAVVPTLNANEFVDSTCMKLTCLNGGTPNGAGGCVCPTLFMGQFCEKDACGERGVLNSARTSCICSLPFTKSAIGGLLCDADTCSGGTVVNTTTGYACACQDSAKVGFNSMSCRPLMCTVSVSNPVDPGCTACLHGGLPFLLNHTLACNCDQTGYEGIFCQKLTCLHGGVYDPVSAACTCPFPFNGTNCFDNVCYNGFPATLDPDTGVNSTCVCMPGWTGTMCSEAGTKDPLTDNEQIELLILGLLNHTFCDNCTIPNPSSSSSSSSTGTVVITTSSSSSALSTNTILAITLPIAGVVLVGGLVLLAYVTGTFGKAGAVVGGSNVQYSTFGRGAETLPSAQGATDLL